MILLKIFLVFISFIASVSATSVLPAFREDLISKAFKEVKSSTAPSSLSRSIKVVRLLSEQLDKGADEKEHRDLAWTLVHILKTGKGVGGLRKQTHPRAFMNSEERNISLRALAKATRILAKGNVEGFLLGESDEEKKYIEDAKEEPHLNHLSQIAAALYAFKEATLDPFQDLTAREKAVKAYLRESPLGDIERRIDETFLQHELPSYYSLTQKFKSIDQMTMEEKAGYYGCLKMASTLTADEKEDLDSLDRFFTTNVRDIWTLVRNDLEVVLRTNPDELKKSLVNHYLSIDEIGTDVSGEGVRFGIGGRSLNAGALESFYDILKALKIPVVMGRNDVQEINLLRLYSHQELVALKTLSLSHNYLNSVILPKELVALQELHLYNNQLTSVTILKELVALQRLSLSYNQLTSVTIPKELVALQVLHLSNNQLNEVSIPKQLVALQVLHLSNNQLTSLPSSLRQLSGRLTLLRVERNPLLNEGDGDNLGITELRAIFGDRFVFDDTSGQATSTLTFKEVLDALDRQSPRLNRVQLAEAQLSSIPMQPEPAGGILGLWEEVLQQLNFTDDKQEGYLSYGFLATDFADARSAHVPNQDRIKHSLLPKLNGFIKTLWGIPLIPGEALGWQMHAASVPEMKQVLIYILTSLRDLPDPAQRSMMFSVLVNGLLHCPTGQREGMDTVVLALQGKVTGGDGLLEETVKQLIARRKNSVFDEKMLPAGNSQNVHIRSFYKNELRKVLGLFTALLSFEERIGIMGNDPFKRNSAEALKTFYSVFTPEMLVKLFLESTENEDDLKLKAERDRLANLMNTKPSTLSSNTEKLNREIKAYGYYQQNKDSLFIDKQAKLDAKTLDATDSDYGILEYFSDFNLEDKKARLAHFATTAASSSDGESEQEAFEALRKDLAGSSPASASAASATASAGSYTEPVDDENKKRLTAIKAQLKMIQQTVRPISMGLILSHLQLSDEEELAAVAASDPKWKEYFTADPFKPNSLATLTEEGAYKVLLKMGYIQE